MDNRFNEIFPFFDLFNKKFVPGDRLIDIFSSCFSFYSTNRQSDKSIKTHIYNLNNISFQVFTDLKYALVVSNASVKNQVTISIAHIYVHNRPIIKTIHYAMNIMSTKAELFTIRCGINQATNLFNIEKIIIITDAIHTAKRIFDLSSHSFQIHAVSISGKLRKFFNKNRNISIEFWDCSS